MALDSGTRLGPYEIVAPIGAGGMGEVYKARDTRLDRIVAVKVLPDSLANNPERKSRFEREAKAISQLNHPNICTLHDVGQHDGVDYLVMEYIEGESLADRLRAGALPLDSALLYAEQIADALGKAHRQGVVHRDLKPANIVLTRAGAKLLDFGLAKLQQQTGFLSPEPEAGNETSQAPTLDHPLTDAHTILGTIQYMAPEQLEGKSVDARSDIFAFGALVYEMVTGRKAFPGESHASVVAAILEKEPPPLAELQPLSPPPLERLLRGCLAKDPENRWQNVQDVGRQLQWVTDYEKDIANRATGTRAPILAAGAVLVAVLAAIFAWNLKPAPATRNRPPVRFSIDLPSSNVFSGLRGWSSTLALSPDGRVLAYPSQTSSGDQLRVRRLDRFESQPLIGTEDAAAPFFSPNGEWVGFFTTNQMKKVRLDGGEATTICDCVGIGASWGVNGDIFFTNEGRSGLSMVSHDGGLPVRLTTVDPEAELWHFSPHVLPDGRHVLFSIWQRSSAGSVALLNRDTGKIRHLDLELPIALTASYSHTGHIVFASMTGLSAVPFDLSSLSVSGPAVTVVEDVLTDAGQGLSHYAISAGGTLVYNPGLVDKRLVWVERNGTTSDVLNVNRPYLLPRVSPDGTRVAMVIYDETLAQRHLWVLERTRGTLTRLTFADGQSTDPVWSPDGERIAFVSNRSGDWSMYTKSSDGSGDAVEVSANAAPRTAMTTSWSRDGQWLLFKEGGASGDWNIGAVRLDTGETRILLDTSFEELFPSLSPDGRFLAYTSNETGRREVYVRAFPELTGKTQISTEGGSEPVWAKDGSEIYYREIPRLMRVAWRGDDQAPGAPELLFEGRFEIEPFGSDTTNYDVSLNGQQFIMVGSTDEYQRLNVVLNWSRELEQLASR